MTSAAPYRDSKHEIFFGKSITRTWKGLFIFLLYLTLSGKKFSKTMTLQGNSVNIPALSKDMAGSLLSCWVAAFLSWILSSWRREMKCTPTGVTITWFTFRPRCIHTGQITGLKISCDSPFKYMYVYGNL